MEESAKCDSRGDRALSPDGRCIIRDDGFYLCCGMTKWLNGSMVNERGKNRIFQGTNVQTGEEKYRGIVAHIPKTNGLLLNFCPFCGSPILKKAHRRETRNSIASHVWGVGSGIALGAALAALVGISWTGIVAAILVIIGVYLSTRPI